eukprot:TRINITY_DN24851_c0_g1_i1.p1 TRINITY_DN24851_c0_g1~~TRINITY_DN24851_c0_g1_i1.p1  ORF type:complete len:1394 (+),score=447.78 TRINITY_DN24851_c0_g1_i1:94-4182(+)
MPEGGGAQEGAAPRAVSFRDPAAGGPAEGAEGEDGDPLPPPDEDLSEGAASDRSPSDSAPTPKRKSVRLPMLSIDAPERDGRRVSDTPSSPWSPAMPGVDPAFRARLIRFYSRYNPSRLGIVDDTAQAYAGKTEELFKMLVKKYGPEPDLDAAPLEPEDAAPDTRARNLSINQHKLRRRAQTLRKAVAPHKQPEGLGPLGRSCRGLVPPVPPSPPELTAPQLRSRRRLVRFYLTYCSSRLDQVDIELAEREWDADGVLQDIQDEFPPSEFPEPRPDIDSVVTVTQEAREAYHACCATTAQSTRLLRRLGVPGGAAQQAAQQAATAAPGSPLSDRRQSLSASAHDRRLSASSSPRLSVTPPGGTTPQRTPPARVPRSPKSTLQRQCTAGSAGGGELGSMYSLAASGRMGTPMELSPPMTPEPGQPRSSSPFDASRPDVTMTSGMTSADAPELSTVTDTPAEADLSLLGGTVTSVPMSRQGSRLQENTVPLDGSTDVIIAGHTVQARVIAELSEEELQYASFRRRRRFRRQDRIALPPSMRCKGCAQFDAVCSNCYMKVRKAGRQRREYFKAQYAGLALKDRVSIFFCAVASGEEDDVGSMLSTGGADPNWQAFWMPEPGTEVQIPAQGTVLSPLHLACAYHRPDLVALLLRHGARYRRDSDGALPLQYVADPDADHDIRMYLLELTTEFDDALAAQEAWDAYHRGDTAEALALFSEVGPDPSGAERDTALVGEAYCLLQSGDWGQCVAVCDRAACPGFEPLFVECEPGHVLEVRKHAQQCWCAEQHPLLPDRALKGCGCVLLGAGCTVPLRMFRRGPSAPLANVFSCLPCDALFDTWHAFYRMPLLRDYAQQACAPAAAADPQGAAALLRRPGSWRGLHAAVAARAAHSWDSRDGELLSCEVTGLEPCAMPDLLAFDLRATLQLLYAPARSALKSLFTRGSEPPKPEPRTAVWRCTAARLPPAGGGERSPDIAVAPCPELPTIDPEKLTVRGRYGLKVPKRDGGRLGIPMQITPSGLKVSSPEAPSDAALRALAEYGVRAGQWVVAVDGKPCPDFEAYSAALAAAPQLVPVTVEYDELDSVLAVQPPLASAGEGSVVSPKGAIVRSAEALDSAEVCTLDCGAAVAVAEIRGRRARITRPVEGWLSLYSGFAVLVASADGTPPPPSPASVAFAGTVWRSARCERIRVHDTEVELAGRRLPLERRADGGLALDGDECTEADGAERIRWAKGGVWTRLHDEFALIDSGDGTGLRLGAPLGMGNGVFAAGSGITNAAVRHGCYDVAGRQVTLSVDTGAPTQLVRSLRLPADPAAAATSVARVCRLMAYGGAPFSVPPPARRALGEVLSYDYSGGQWEAPSKGAAAKR